MIKKNCENKTDDRHSSRQTYFVGVLLRDLEDRQYWNSITRIAPSSSKDDDIVILVIVAARVVLPLRGDRCESSTERRRHFWSIQRRRQPWAVTPLKMIASRHWRYCRRSLYSAADAATAAAYFVDESDCSVRNPVPSLSGARGTFDADTAWCTDGGLAAAAHDPRPGDQHTGACSNLTSTANRSLELASETRRQERVDDRIHRRVGVREYVSGDAAVVEWVRVAPRRPEVVGPEPDDVRRQPAEGEDADDDGDQASDASLGDNRPTSRRLVVGRLRRPELTHGQRRQDPDRRKRYRVPDDEQYEVSGRTVFPPDAPPVVRAQRDRLVLEDFEKHRPGRREHRRGGPDGDGDGQRVRRRAEVLRAERVADGEETVERHGDERVDRGGHAGELDEVDELAERVAERPVLRRVNDGVERNAEDQEEQVGDGEVDDE